MTEICYLQSFRPRAKIKIKRRLENEENCILNRNIPNELSYREKLLSEEEMASLIENTKETDEPVEDIIINITDIDGNILDELTIETLSK